VDDFDGGSGVGVCQVTRRRWEITWTCLTVPHSRYRTMPHIPSWTMAATNGDIRDSLVCSHLWIYSRSFVCRNH